MQNLKKKRNKKNKNLAYTIDKIARTGYFVFTVSSLEKLMGTFVDGGFSNDCEHDNNDAIPIGSGYYPRCINCGDILYESKWMNSAILVSILFAQGDDEIAKELMEYMRIGKEELGLPYPINSEEKYKEIAEVMRKQTTKS